MVISKANVVELALRNQCVAVDRRPNTKLTFGDVIRHSKTARRD
ncbi:serine protease domain protein, partial [Vibrio parahaemolyticus VP-48]